MSVMPSCPATTSDIQMEATEETIEGRTSSRGPCGADRDQVKLVASTASQIEEF